MKKVRGTDRVTVSDILTSDSVKSAIDSVTEMADSLDTVVIAYTTRQNDVGFVASTHAEAEIIGLLEVTKFSVIERMEKPYET